MKITAERDDQSQYIVRIVVEPNELEEAKGKAAKKLSNSLRIPGFRPGKAPRALVERFVGQEALIEQATKDLFPKAYQNALKQDQNIRPIAHPNIEIESFEPLTIKATVAVEPSVELGNYQDIRFELTNAELTEDEIEKVIVQLREQQSTWEAPEIERPAEQGDQVEIELQTMRDGETKGDSFQRTGVLGKGELLHQIDDQVVGMTLGEERVIEVKRQAPKPAAAVKTPTDADMDETDADVDELTQEAGSEVDATVTETETEQPVEQEPMHFRVVLNTIKVKHEPELDEAFAQTVSDTKNMDELTERIRKNLLSQKENTYRRELTDKIIKEAVDISIITMPPIMVDAEIEALEQNRAERLKQQKLSLDQYLKYIGKDHHTFHDELRPEAENRIRTALVLREIARAENINVGQGEIDREVEKMVDEFTINAPNEERDDRVLAARSYFSQEQTRTQLREELFSRKLSDRLIEIATGVSPNADDDDSAVLGAASQESDS